jgi:hypothetical protein
MYISFDSHVLGGRRKRGIVLNALKKRPEIRSGFLHQTLKMIELLDPAVKKRILDRVPQATIQAISKAKENEWLPLEYDILITEHMMAEISEEEYTKRTIAASKSAIESSLMGPFIRSALYLFKISPKTVLKIGPQIWSTCYRNCGNISVVEKGPCCVQIVLEDLPQVFVDSRPYLLTTSLFIHAMDNFTGAQNIKVVIEQQSKMNRSAVFSVTWEAD